LVEIEKWRARLAGEFVERSTRLGGSDADLETGRLSRGGHAVNERRAQRQIVDPESAWNEHRRAPHGRLPRQRDQIALALHLDAEILFERGEDGADVAELEMTTEAQLAQAGIGDDDTRGSIAVDLLHHRGERVAIEHQHAVPPAQLLLQGGGVNVDEIHSRVFALADDA